HFGRWHQACSRLLIILQGVRCRWPVVDPTVAASSVRRRRRRDDLGQRRAPGSWLRQFSNAPWPRIRVAREFYPESHWHRETGFFLVQGQLLRAAWVR